VWTKVPVWPSKIDIVASIEAAASRSPVGDHAVEMTGPVCAFDIHSSRPCVASNATTVPSSSAHVMSRESGDHDVLFIGVGVARICRFRTPAGRGFGFFFDSIPLHSINRLFGRRHATSRHLIWLDSEIGSNFSMLDLFGSGYAGLGDWRSAMSAGRDRVSSWCPTERPRMTGSGCGQRCFALTADSIVFRFCCHSSAKFPGDMASGGSPPHRRCHIREARKLESLVNCFADWPRGRPPTASKSTVCRLCQDWSETAFGKVWPDYFPQVGLRHSTIGSPDPKRPSRGPEVPRTGRLSKAAP
jgi:hypothetical protein